MVSYYHNFDVTNACLYKHILSARIFEVDPSLKIKFIDYFSSIFLFNIFLHYYHFYLFFLWLIINLIRRNFGLKLFLWYFKLCCVFFFLLSLLQNKWKFVPKNNNLLWNFKFLKTLSFGVFFMEFYINYFLKIWILPTQ